MTKFHDLTPAQALAAQEDRLDTLIVPYNPQPKPWKGYALEGGCQVSDWSFEPGRCTEDGETFTDGLWAHSRFVESQFYPAPYALGDRIVCREEWTMLPPFAPGVNPTFIPRAGYNNVPPATVITDWQPAEEMPYEYSRLTLEVTGVTVRKDDAGQWAAHYGVTKS